MGKMYEVEEIKVHSAHTRAYLKEFAGYFNHVKFDIPEEIYEEALNILKEENGF